MTLTYHPIYGYCKEKIIEIKKNHETECIFRKCIDTNIVKVMPRPICTSLEQTRMCLYYYSKIHTDRNPEVLFEDIEHRRLIRWSICLEDEQGLTGILEIFYPISPIWASIS